MAKARRGLLSLKKPQETKPTNTSTQLCHLYTTTKQLLSQLTSLVQQQVFGLDVPVDHVQPVQVLQRSHQLEDVPRRHRLGEPPPRLRLHGAVQLPLPGVLHHNEDPDGGVKVQKSRLGKTELNVKQ